MNTFAVSLDSVAELWNFHEAELAPIALAIQYNGDRVPRGIRISLSESLLKGGYLVKTTGPDRRPNTVLSHQFKQPQEMVQFALYLRAATFVNAGPVSGQILIFDIDRDDHLPPISVTVPRIKTIQDAPFDSSPLVLDFGGQGTVIAATGRHDQVACIDGFPLPVQVLLQDVGGKIEMVSPTRGMPTTGRLVEHFKSALSTGRIDAELAPGISYRGLIRQHLQTALGQALRQRRRRPPQIIATVPAAWSDSEIGLLQSILNEVLAAHGLAGTELIFVDEASAGGIGVLQKLVQSGEAAAHLQLLDEPGQQVVFCTIDMGAVSTDMSVCTLSVEKTPAVKGDPYPRFLANTRVEGIVGIPAAGFAFTRLLMLMLVARLAERRLAQTRSDQREPIQPQTEQDIRNLAVGKITELDDPFLTGIDNSRSRRLLSQMAELVPPWSPSQPDRFTVAKKLLFQIAEWAKIALNSREAAGLYPARVEAAPFQKLWPKLSAFYGAADMQVPAVTFEELRQVFTPAIEHILNALLKLVHASAGKNPIAFVCLSGQGSLLRLFRDETDNVLLGRLPASKFDLHATRLLCRDDPLEAKLVVALGAYNVVASQMEQQTWIWSNDDLRLRLPFDIGVKRISGEFVPMVRRGTKLPTKVEIRRPCRAITLYRSDIGEPVSLGRLRFDAAAENGSGPVSFVVDKSRQISNVSGATLDRSDSTPDPRRVPLLDEMGRMVPHW